MAETLESAVRISEGAMQDTARASIRVSVVDDEGVVLGAFQRKTEAPTALVKRATGGPALTVSRGTVHVVLSLASPSALMPADCTQILNRYVRPLLRALTKLGGRASYFGREWVSVAHAPAAFVGFAHEARTQRTSFEAWIGVHHAVLEAGRASLLGKAPRSLSALTERALDATCVVEAVHAAYAAAFGALPSFASASEVSALPDDPPWQSTREEAIGPIGAGPDHRGVFRIGGELMVSRDALLELEGRIGLLVRAASSDPGASATSPGEVARAVELSLMAGNVALFGVRDPASIRDLLVGALK